MATIWLNEFPNLPKTYLARFGLLQRVLIVGRFIWTKKVSDISALNVNALDWSERVEGSDTIASAPIDALWNALMLLAKFEKNLDNLCGVHEIEYEEVMRDCVGFFDGDQLEGTPLEKWD